MKIENSKRAHTCGKPVQSEKSEHADVIMLSCRMLLVGVRSEKNCKNNNKQWQESTI